MGRVGAAVSARRADALRKHASHPEVSASPSSLPGKGATRIDLSIRHRGKWMPALTIEAFVARFPRAGGFDYVLTSEAHPHLLKIGFTTRSPAERALELDATGSPHPFKVAFA